MATLFSLEGKTALVTGGGKGIGQAIAVGLAEAGADIILILRDLSQVDTKNKIEALGRKCWTYACELSDKAAVSKIIPTISADHTVSILVNGAGIMRRIAAAEIPTDTFDEILQVNLNTTFTLSRDVGKIWIKNNTPGRIINVSSLAMFQGGINMAAYAASKGGVGQLTKALSNEWAKHGIRVNAIAPGYVATDMNVDTRTNPDKTYYNSITQRIPMGRWGNIDEFKGPAVFLASDASSYVSGEILVVDGGWLGR